MVIIHIYILHFAATDLLTVVYPDYEDITGAAKALLRVQQTYGLDTSAVSQGILPGSPKGLELSGNLFSVVHL